MTRRLPRRIDFQPGIRITGPASGTTFYTGEATTVTLAGPDGTYETSWVPDFATTNGNIVVASGTGSGNVTPAWADGIAAVERTTLYVRKAGGGGSSASQSALIYTPPKAAVQDGTVQLSYDLGRASTVTQGAGVCTACAPDAGGTAADVLNGTGHAPTYNAADAEFGGRASVENTGTQWMQSTTPASSIDRSADHVLVLFGKQPTRTSSSRYYADAASGGNLNVYNSTGTSISIFGTAALSVALNTTDTTATFCKFSSAKGTLQTRADDGELVKVIGTVGIPSAKGLTIFAYKNGSATYIAETAKLTAALVVTGISPADIYRLEQWYQLPAARGGCAASGWTPAIAPNVYLENAGWWPTAPTLGTVTTSSASVPADVSSWATQEKIVITGGQSDPVGGSNAFLITEAVGAGAGYHRVYQNSTNVAAAPYEFHVWLKTDGSGRRIYVSSFGVANTGFTINNDTGTLVSKETSVDSVTLTESTGAWNHWVAVYSTHASVYPQLIIENGAGLLSYDAGAGGFGCYVYAPNMTYQIRVQQIADQSGVGAHLTQATAANQPLFWDETVNGIVVAHSEPGRVSGTSVTNTVIAAVVNGTDTSFAVAGVLGMPGRKQYSRPCWIYGPGFSNYVVPFYINDAAGAVLRSSRIGAGGTSHQDLTYNGEFDTPKAYVYWYDGTTRVGRLYIAGVLAYTWGAHSAAGVVTCTTITQGSGYSSTAPNEIHADMGLFAGLPPSYAYLQYALARIALPYGLAT